MAGEQCFAVKNDVDEGVASAEFGNVPGLPDARGFVICRTYDAATNNQCCFASIGFVHLEVQIASSDRHTTIRPYTLSHREAGSLVADLIAVEFNGTEFSPRLLFRKLNEIVNLTELVYFADLCIIFQNIGEFSLMKL